MCNFLSIQTQNTRRIQHITVSNTIMGNIIVLLLRGDNFDKAMEILMSLIEAPNLIVGTITADHVREIFELCLAQAHVPAIFVSISSLFTQLLINFYVLTSLHLYF